MVLHNSGAISASQIRSEYNQTGPFSLGGTGRSVDKRIPQSAAINYSNFYNKYYQPNTSNLKVWLDGKEYSGSGTTWTDLQGNANGTLNNNPIFSKPYFTFNGTDQYITLPTTSDITDFTTSNNYTISFWSWISSTQSTSDSNIVEKWSGTGGYPYVVRFISATSGITMATYDTNTNPGVTVSNCVNVNDWNHVTAVFDWTNNIMTLHVNGVQKASSIVTKPTDSINNTGLLNIMRSGDSSKYVNGRVGMLMIYNTSLTAYQNKLLYYSTRNVFNIIPTELEHGTWNVLYEYLNPKRNTFGSLSISKDLSSSLTTQTINRIGYYMQNNMSNGSTTYWVFVTMDVYTTNLSDLKIPDQTNAFTNQRNVTNLQVYSNHPQVGNYTAANGRLEFWTWDYSQNSNLGGGSNNVFDFDDTSGGGGAYGSVQVHDVTNSKTILSWNNHANGERQDIGIGNNDVTNIHYTSSGGNPDWTYAANNAYNWKFQVLLGTIPYEPSILNSDAWRTVYELTNPTRTLAGALTISTDNSTTLGSPTFTKVAYYMQNNMGNGSTTYWIFVIMDAYTTNLIDLKIPDITNAFTNQRNVTNLQVYSNHPQVGNYTAANGRLEIWPWDYSPTSNLGGGSNTVFDIDDTSDGSGAYGSVQVHDITNSKTILAWNNHANGQSPDIGIGNNDVTNIHYTSSGDPDWKSAGNSAYNWKFQVLINSTPLNPATLETGTWNVLYEFTNSRRDTSGTLTYNKDNTSIYYGKTFARIGYYMQNNMNNGPTSYYVYVTMDAYTTNINDLKIPDDMNQFVNQRNVTNIKVYSNHPQVGTYTATNGRVEIWPYDYSTTTTFGNGNQDIYDFDDTPTAPMINGNGSVQIHDITNSKTLLGWNMHRSTGNQDIGIGNNDVTNIHYASAGGPDWTSTGNNTHNWKFQVYIKST
jgi:hypothetical protein